MDLLGEALAPFDHLAEGGERLPPRYRDALSLS